MCNIAPSLLISVLPPCPSNEEPTVNFGTWRLQLTVELKPPRHLSDNSTITADWEWKISKYKICARIKHELHIIPVNLTAPLSSTTNVLFLTHSDDVDVGMFLRQLLKFLQVGNKTLSSVMWRRQQLPAWQQPSTRESCLPANCRGSGSPPESVPERILQPPGCRRSAARAPCWRPSPAQTRSFWNSGCRSWLVSVQPQKSNWWSDRRFRCSYHAHGSRGSSVRWEGRCCSTRAPIWWRWSSDRRYCDVPCQLWLEWREISGTFTI